MKNVDNFFVCVRDSKRCDGEIFLETIFTVYPPWIRCNWGINYGWTENCQYRRCCKNGAVCGMIRSHLEEAIAQFIRQTREFDALKLLWREVLQLITCGSESEHGRSVNIIRSALIFFPRLPRIFINEGCFDGRRRRIRVSIAAVKLRYVIRDKNRMALPFFVYTQYLHAVRVGLLNWKYM